MHILLLTPGFAADEMDQTCIPPLQALVRGLVKHSNNRVSILPVHYPFRKEQYTWNGVSVYPVGAANNRFPMRFFSWQKVLQTFRKINENNPVDLIHSFWWSECALLGEWLAKKHSIKHINTLMGQEPLQRNAYQRMLKRTAIPRYALSPFHESEFKKSHQLNVNGLVPWGLETEKLPIPETIERSVDLLGVGSLIPLKRYMDFVLVVEYLVKDFPNLKVELVGDGPERITIETAILQKGLSRHFHLTGKIQRDKVLAKMQESKILFHPSEYESFGYVFAEGLYCGMQVVSRPVGAFTSIPQWQTGHTVEEFVGLIRNILLSPLEPQSVLLQSIDETAQQYLTIYRAELSGTTGIVENPS